MSITPTLCELSFKKEASFRDGGGSGAALTTTNAFDLTSQYTETVELPEPLRKIVERFLSGSRNVGAVIDVGYDAGESSWTFDLLSGIFLYYVLGACTTSGSAPAFTHAITEANTIPSFAIHYVQAIPTDNISIDLFGCVVKSLEITIETGSETPVKCTVELMCAKAIIGGSVTQPTKFNMGRFVRKDVDTFTLTYQAAGLDTDMKSAEKYVLRIENEIDFKPYLGDEYPARMIIGKRIYSQKYTLPIRNSKWRKIMNRKVPNISTQYSTGNYLYTAIASQVKLLRDADANDKIDVVFTHLYPVPSRDIAKMPSWEDKELVAEVEFKPTPINSASFSVIDTLSGAYYETG